MSDSILYSSLILFILVIFLFSVLRLLVKTRQERQGVKENSGSQVEFVVSTFHDLVSRLKEKEKELSDLRQKAEQRAGDIESYNEYILQSVPSGVISIDGHGKITKINYVASQTLGINARELTGRHHKEVLPDALANLFEAGATIRRKDVQIVRQPGKKIMLGVSLTPLLNASRESIGQLLVFSDMTELKALEAQAELRNRLSSLGEMTAGMAHELRNPLAVIAGYLKLLSQKTDPSASYMIEAISKEVAGINRIISDFLSFARPDNLSLSTVDLAKLMSGCIENMAGARDDIRVCISGTEIPEITCDEMLVKQAFTNLVQNALDAMPEGGELRIDFASEGNAVDIRVSDSGMGISENMMEKIFLPFYTTKTDGTGLGLSIVQKIIISHQGAITAESSEKGASFRIRLPVSQIEED